MLDEFRNDLLREMRENFEVSEIGCEPYTEMKYPKLIPVMHFHTERYEVKEFGHLFLMKTDAMGKMHLMTASLMPDSGKAVPYLLIDLMEMGKKLVVFVEYYNCTGRELDTEKLEEVAGRYQIIEDYAEKPAWYVGRRMKGSMIKSGNDTLQETLLQMIRDSLNAYIQMIQNAERSPECLKGLKTFRDEMIEKGNPSTGTLVKVLGKAGAEKFFREMVMPLDET